jgi:hypothetical protein
MYQVSSIIPGTMRANENKTAPYGAYRLIGKTHIKQNHSNGRV